MVLPVTEFMRPPLVILADPGHPAEDGLATVHILHCSLSGKEELENIIQIFDGKKSKIFKE